MQSRSPGLLDAIFNTNVVIHFFLMIKTNGIVVVAMVTLHCLGLWYFWYILQNAISKFLTVIILEVHQSSPNDHQICTYPVPGFPPVYQKMSCILKAWCLNKINKTSAVKLLHQIDGRYIREPHSLYSKQMSVDTLGISDRSDGSRLWSGRGSGS